MVLTGCMVTDKEELGFLQSLFPGSSSMKHTDSISLFVYLDAQTPKSTSSGDGVVVPPPALPGIPHTPAAVKFTHKDPGKGWQSKLALQKILGAHHKNLCDSFSITISPS